MAVFDYCIHFYTTLPTSALKFSNWTTAFVERRNAVRYERRSYHIQYNISSWHQSYQHNIIFTISTGYQLIIAPDSNYYKHIQITLSIYVYYSRTTKKFTNAAYFSAKDTSTSWKRPENKIIELAIHVMNELSDTIRTITSKVEFKSRLITYLFAT